MKNKKLGKIGKKNKAELRAVLEKQRRGFDLDGDAIAERRTQEAIDEIYELLDDYVFGIPGPLRPEDTHIIYVMEHLIDSLARLRTVQDDLASVYEHLVDVKLK